MLAATACGGSDDSTSDGDLNLTATVSDAPQDDAASDATGDEEAPTMPDVSMPDLSEMPMPEGSGNATLTLDNGESFEFDGVMCVLEPQVAAGQEILFTATSYGDPGLDVSQFGDAAVPGMASIDVYDADYNTLWEAFDMGTGTVELTLDGSTINGTASFYPGTDDDTGQPVSGEVVVNC